MNDIEAIVSELKKDKERLSNLTASGGCTSFEGYKEVVGRIKGIDSSLQTIWKICQKQEITE